MTRLAFWLMAAVLGVMGGQAWAATPLAGKLIAFQGEVAVCRQGTQDWLAAQLHQELYPGDAVRTGALSRAAILAADESQIKLNEHTLFVLKSAAPSPRLKLTAATTAVPEKPAPSLYGVSQGEIWLRNSNEKFRFELETPAVTGAIRGTELNARVARDGATRLVLLDGSLNLFNPHGQVALKPGEEGWAEPGKAPGKRLLVQPADAVQWALYYPGIFSYRDLPLMSAVEPGREPSRDLLRQAEKGYDGGLLDQAKEAAEAGLRSDPGSNRALTVLGWVALQRGDLPAAAGYFQKVQRPREMALIGLALARYRGGDSRGAYELLQQAGAQVPPSPVLLSLTGYFALLAGRPEEAQEKLQAALGLAPDAALPRALLAQMHLVQNRKAPALAEAEEALAKAPGSPLANLTLALVKIASFDLPAARHLLQKAIQLDPAFITPYLYLAKIYLGGDFLARARETMEKAITIAPKDAEARSLAGFVRLAYRDYAGARRFFEEAAAANPNLGEPHLGLGICQFRYRDYPGGLGAILTATLLDPRVSAYQSELGKALYQVRHFDKALEVYDYAKTLDPRDPTPHLYKGIALTDLNRPGEAIQEINRSIALNDNKAVFRSRLMLDRDLAVRNYNLARAYNILGLGDWAYSKAVTAVKDDPLNSSAHLFLADSYFTSGQLVMAADAERLIYRVLAPANQNTFTSLRLGESPLSNDYTPMFELPYARLALQAGGGFADPDRPIQDHFLVAYGGWPGAAFYGGGFYVKNNGIRFPNSDYRLYNIETAVKWEPRVNDCFLGFFQHWDTKKGDNSNVNDFSYRNDPNYRYYNRFRMYELGYVHRFSPNAALLGYFTYQNLDTREHLRSRFFDQVLINVSQNSVSDWYFKNYQIQQQLVLGKHTLIGGFDYFDGYLNFNLRGLATAVVFGETFALRFRTENQPPERSYSLYLLDYWKVTSNLLVEFGLFRDVAKNSRGGFAAPISNQQWNPRLGINYRVNDRHTLRLALQRHLNTHYLLQASLVPTEVASFPYLIDTDHGTVVNEAGAAWEAQWNPKTFTVLRFNAHRLTTPDFNEDGQRIWWGWKRYLASFTVNRILTPSLGLTLAANWRRLDPSFPGNLDLNFNELNAFINLSYLHPKGWLAQAQSLLVFQDLHTRKDNRFGIVNLRVGKEFPNKRGIATFTVTNLFNRHFNYVLEPMRDAEFIPVRRIMFHLALYF